MTLHHETTVPAVRFPSAVGIAANLAVTVKTMVRTWTNRAALRRLEALSEHELSDLGITRGDLFCAGGSRWNEDPTRRLGTLRNERRIDAEMAARRIC